LNSVSTLSAGDAGLPRTLMESGAFLGRRVSGWPREFGGTVALRHPGSRPPQILQRSQVEHLPIGFVQRLTKVSFHLGDLRAHNLAAESIDCGKACGSRSWGSLNATVPTDPTRGIANARPLRPLPEPITDLATVTHLDIRRRDRLGGIIHEYEHAA
jgi:hypothetical protein